MNQLKITCCSLCFAAIPVSLALGSPTVIAGSERSTPPAYWQDSFYPLGRSISRAFPFEVDSSGSYRVDELHIVAFHYPSLTGSQAIFSLHEDSQGAPGAVLTSFFANNITTAAEVHELEPSVDILLRSPARYWIVGQTRQQQVNWNLGDSAFGETAFKRPGNPWTFQGDNRNIAAYALVGTLVPEPANSAFAVCMALNLFCMGRHRRKIQNTLLRPAQLMNPLPAFCWLNIGLPLGAPGSLVAQGSREKK